MYMSSFRKKKKNCQRDPFPMYCMISFRCLILQLSPYHTCVETKMSDAHIHFTLADEKRLNIDKRKQ